MMTTLPCCDADRKSRDRWARFSADRIHRYALWSRWDRRPLLVALMLNPSTADENVLDPTLTRVAQYARDWDCGGFEIVNAFSYRSTDPSALVAVANEPVVWPLNRLRDIITDLHIRRAFDESSMVLVGWGTNLDRKPLSPRVRELQTLIGGRPVQCWKHTAGGHPSHPLYLRKDTVPVPFVWPGYVLHDRPL
jgi:hypothetical protein